MTLPVRATAPRLILPGKRTRVGLLLPDSLSENDWLKCGKVLAEVEGAVQWWLGDWWAYGAARKYGDGAELAEQAGVEYGTIRNYASVASAFRLSLRNDNLSFDHHRAAMAVPDPERLAWLAKAERLGWSSNQLRANIKQDAAFERTREVELDAARLGKFVVLYADPPWRYENPPMGGGNRSIENHYPTMELEEICALRVSDVAHENAMLFLWATSPKLAECMTVIEAWGFTYRTDMVWAKDKIGMGYHVREKHESLLIAKRGELAPPATDARPDSVIEAPRLEHSAKPLVFLDIIDRMYPGVRKLELFNRDGEQRAEWTAWGNQAGDQSAA